MDELCGISDKEVVFPMRVWRILVVTGNNVSGKIDGASNRPKGGINFVSFGLAIDSQGLRIVRF